MNAEFESVAQEAVDDAAMTPFSVLLDYERRSLSHVAGLPDQLEAPGL